MKKGFTLAEVLITLAVIGIVAALTIPVVMNKYQKKTLYTQFMKTYNTMATALDMTVEEHGDLSGWNWGKPAYDEEPAVEGDSPFKNYILAQLKVAKTCDDAEDCFASSYVDLTGKDVGELLFDYIGDDVKPVAAVLQDGSAIVLYDKGTNDLAFLVDTNGKKGPNVFGRDLFYIGYGKENYDSEENQIILFPYATEGDYAGTCNPSDTPSEYGENGVGCASRLIQEGKMNY